MIYNAGIVIKDQEESLLRPSASFTSFSYLFLNGTESIMLFAMAAIQLMKFLKKREKELKEEKVLIFLTGICDLLKQRMVIILQEIDVGIVEKL